MLLIYLPIDAHLGCLHFVGIMSTAALNIHIFLCVCRHILIYRGYCIRIPQRNRTYSPEIYGELRRIYYIYTHTMDTTYFIRTYTHT